MSVQQEHATSETATLTTTESGGVYQSLFDKINLTPVSSIQEIDSWQNSETLADASPDERVTAAIHVLLSCLAKSGEDVVKLDKSLLDFHIDDLDQKISKQLDAVMHHPEFQKVESLWRGTWFVVQRTDFRKNVRIELLDISKEHLRQDFDDSPEIIQSGLYRHTYIQEYDTPGGEPVASLISSYEFDNSPQDIALLRNISKCLPLPICLLSVPSDRNSSLKIRWKKSPRLKISATTLTAQNILNGSRSAIPMTAATWD